MAEAPRVAPTVVGSGRRLLRALHRDLGYLAVGLTLIYAASGLAVNHVADWDPNFRNYSVVHELGPLAPERAAELALERLGIQEKPREVYRASADRIDVVLERHTLHVDPGSGRVIDEGQKPRLFLRLANWLHLNRGKKAWTYAADFYAAGLLVLAVSGMFMLPGRRGIAGRGAVFVIIGIAIPMLYVGLSGGP